MVAFASWDFDVAEDTSLADVTTPHPFVDNSDRQFWTALAANNEAQSAATDRRVAGFDVAPGSSHYIVRGKAIFGDDTNFHQPGLLVRWNGEAFGATACRLYRLLIRAFAQDWAIARTRDGTTTWLPITGEGGSTNKALDDAGIGPIGINEEFEYAIEVENDGATVKLTAYFLDAEWKTLGVVIDDSANRIEEDGFTGMAADRPEVRFRHLEAEVLTEPGVDEFYRDDFDNVESDQLLSDRTDPYAYSGSTTQLSVFATDDAVGISGAEAFRAFGPVVTPPEDGYITTGVFTLGAGTDETIAVVGHYNGDDWGSGDEGYYWQYAHDVDNGRLRLIRRSGGSQVVAGFSDSDFGQTHDISLGSELTLMLQPRTVETDNVLLNAWVRIDGGSAIHVVDDFLHTSNTIPAIGKPGAVLRNSGQRLHSLQASVDVDITDLTISSVSPSVIRHGDAVTITGNFPETVTALTINGTAHDIDTQDAESVNFTFALGNHDFGAKTLTLSDGTTQDSTAVFVQTVAGNDWVEVANLPWPEGQESIFEDAAPPVENGMQAEWTAVTDLGADVVVNSDGTFEIEAHSGTHKFSARVHDNIEWGPWAEFTTEATEEATEVMGPITHALARFDEPPHFRSRFPGGPVGNGANPPAQVAGLQTTTITSSSVGLDWDAVADADTYTVYLNGAVEQSGVEGTSTTVTGLNPETTYNSPGFQVSGVNAEGEGELSAAVTATTPAAGDLAAAGVTGAIEEGETITVSSDGVNGFGAGDTELYLYEDFDGDHMGSATYSQKNNPLFETEKHSKTDSVVIVDNTEQFNHVNFAATGDIYVSYWVFRPSDKVMPWRNGVDEDGYNTGGSALKYVWLAQDGGSWAAGNGPDICLPTNHSGYSYSVHGNDLYNSNKHHLGDLRDWHKPGEWCYFAIMLSESDLLLRTRQWSPSGGWLEKDTTFPTVDDYWDNWEPESDRYFTRLNYTGWVDSNEDAFILLDDMNISSGRGAGNRVLIGDAAEIAQCTDLMDLPVVSRTTDSIDVVVKRGPFADLAGKYIFVLDTKLDIVPYDGANSREIV